MAHIFTVWVLPLNHSAPLYYNTGFEYRPTGLLFGIFYTDRTTAGFPLHRSQLLPSPAFVIHYTRPSWCHGTLNILRSGLHTGYVYPQSRLNVSLQNHNLASCFIWPWNLI
jgi:hypothetical protein